eukprot:CAMPEP_0206517140 /NCGR_PEP_ID=MMETSP0324_2-20121206/63791_1 /ASSEMBLY_ACC=CAM_ASM_000836 /TAXON_ID=2866 /ORGANISM="Crypthecodinium cohnii, Strain Seligo" /LENGTH=44 /DNA_ID= /DNA_START= /DNA_END= /DNA_ORIENTATION=
MRRATVRESGGLIVAKASIGPTLKVVSCPGFCGEVVLQQAKPSA